MATMTKVEAPQEKPAQYTLQNGSVAFLQRFKETNRDYSSCFGDEAFRLKTSFGTLIGWRVQGDLSLSAAKICDTLYKLIAAERSVWQCQRPKSKVGNNSFDVPSYTLECFLLGVAKSHASPHVTIVCDVEWFSKSLRAIIVNSKLLLVHTGWGCFRLPFQTTPNAPGSSSNTEAPAQHTAQGPYQLYYLNGQFHIEGGIAVEIWRGPLYIGRTTIGGLVETQQGLFGLTVTHAFFPCENTSDSETNHPKGKAFQIDESELAFFNNGDGWDSDSNMLSPGLSTRDVGLESITDMSSLMSEGPNLLGDGVVTPHLVSGALPPAPLSHWMVGKLVYASGIQEHQDPSTKSLDWALVSLDLPALASIIQSFEKVPVPPPSLFETRSQITLHTADPFTMWRTGSIISSAVFGVPSCASPQPVVVASGLLPFAGDSGSWG